MSTDSRAELGSEKVTLRRLRHWASRTLSVSWPKRVYKSGLANTEVLRQGSFFGAAMAIASPRHDSRHLAKLTKPAKHRNRRVLTLVDLVLVFAQNVGGGKGTERARQRPRRTIAIGTGRGLGGQSYRRARVEDGRQERKHETPRRRRSRTGGQAGLKGGGWCRFRRLLWRPFFWWFGGRWTGELRMDGRLALKLRRQKKNIPGPLYGPGRWRWRYRDRHGGMYRYLGRQDSAKVLLLLLLLRLPIFGPAKSGAVIIWNLHQIRFLGSGSFQTLYLSQTLILPCFQGTSKPQSLTPKWP